MIFDPRLIDSSILLADLLLCQARLQADARWPWIVLIPRRPELREIEQLAAGERIQLMDEIMTAGRAVRAMGLADGRPVDKLNIGQLGNVVSQLHVHVLGRRADDPAWPGPVWGFGQALPYPADALELALATARAQLALA